MPVLIEQIHLRGKYISETQFVFLAEYWEAQLKPYKKAKWTHEAKDWFGRNIPNNYRLKQGAFLVFPEFKTQGGLYAAHLYAIVKELPDGPIYCTFTNEGLVMESKEEGRVIQRVTLKYRAPLIDDTLYHAVVSY